MVCLARDKDFSGDGLISLPLVSAAVSCLPAGQKDVPWAPKLLGMVSSKMACPSSLALGFLLLGRITVHRAGFLICLLLFQLLMTCYLLKTFLVQISFVFFSPLLQLSQTPGLSSHKLRPSIRHYFDDGGERGMESLLQMEQTTRFFINRWVRFYLHGRHGPVLDQPSVSGLY